MPGFSFPVLVQAFELARLFVVGMHLQRKPIGAVQQLDQQRKAGMVHGMVAQQLGGKVTGQFTQSLARVRTRGDPVFFINHPGFGGRTGNLRP